VGFIWGAPLIHSSSLIHSSIISPCLGVSLFVNLSWNRGTDATHDTDTLARLEDAKDEESLSLSIVDIDIGLKQDKSSLFPARRRSAHPFISRNDEYDLSGDVEGYTVLSGFCFEGFTFTADTLPNFCQRRVD
jgi:hypothetical protein